MKRKRFTVEQIVAVLKTAEAGVPMAELIRRLGISEQTFYRWKRQYVGLEVDQVLPARSAAQNLHNPFQDTAIFDPRATAPAMLRQLGGKDAIFFHCASVSSGRDRAIGPPSAPLTLLIAHFPKLNHSHFKALSQGVQQLLGEFDDLDWHRNPAQRPSLLDP